MARTKKYNVSDEDLKALDEGLVSPKDINEKYSMTDNYAYTLKAKRKAKLKTNFELKLADKNTTDIVNKPQENINPTTPNSVSIQPQLDFEVLVRGMWAGVDGALKLMSVLSRGSIEYTRLSKEEIETLTEASKNNGIVQKIASLNNMGALVLVGTIAVTFNGKIKLKTHKKDNENCDCPKCEKKRKEEVKEIKETSDKQDLEKKKETVKNRANEIIKDLNEKFVETNPSGAFIENNSVNKIPSEAEVLAQNTGGKKINW